jgi:transposase-like protein
MSKKRRQHSPEFKFKVALEAAKGNKTVAEVASEAGVHPNQISQWKGQLLDEGATLFRRNGDRSLREFEQREAELYEQIGRLQMELDWLKKKAARFG